MIRPNLSILFVVLALGAAGHAQTPDPNPREVDRAIEERIRNITSLVIEEINFRKEPGYYIPSFAVGFRFGGEALFNGQTTNPHLPVFGFFADLRFMRFTQGFALLRMMVETPMIEQGKALSADLNILNSKYVISGGFGGGFSFLDTRLGNLGKGNVLMIIFIATVGSRFGRPGDNHVQLSTFGGAEINFRYQYYFHRYASLQLGFDVGLRFGLTSTATYGVVIGASF